MISEFPSGGSRARPSRKWTLPPNRTTTAFNGAVREQIAPTALPRACRDFDASPARVGPARLPHNAHLPGPAFNGAARVIYRLPTLA